MKYLPSQADHPFMRCAMYVLPLALPRLSTSRTAAAGLAVRVALLLFTRYVFICRLIHRGPRGKKSTNSRSYHSKNGLSDGPKMEKIFQNQAAIVFFIISGESWGSGGAIKGQRLPQAGVERRETSQHEKRCGHKAWHDGLHLHESPKSTAYSIVGKLFRWGGV